MRDHDVVVVRQLATASKTWPDLRRAAHLGLTVLAAHHGPVCRQLAGASRPLVFHRSGFSRLAESA